MTRINTIDPVRLTDQHLMAEYRELPRAFRLAARATSFKAPVAYTMGTGHVLFFYERTDYLSMRQGAIIAELLSRGFDIQHHIPPEPLRGCKSGWMPDARAQRVCLERLCERLASAPRPGFYTYRGVAVKDDFYSRWMT